MEGLSHDISVDVIVIGDGAAGIAAALSCLQKGLKTLLIGDSNLKQKGNSKQDTIESIHPGVLSILSHLKIDLNFPSAKLGTYSYISNGKVRKSLNPYTEAIWEGFHISKTHFSNHLMIEAQKQNLIVLNEAVENVIVEEGRIVGVKTKSGIDYFSKYTIDASGSKRTIGKRMNFHEKFYSPTLVAWTGISFTEECDFNESQNAYFIPNKDGWTWIAQLENKSFYWTKLSSKKKADFLGPAEIIKSYKTIFSKVANMRWRIFRPLCIEGGILCGDAACLIDPAAGQGIFNALSSGIKAGQTAVACIQNMQFENIILAEYDSLGLIHFEQKINQLKEYYNTEGVNVMTKSTHKKTLS
jgi:flavin-dependent dehydrogenase